MRPPSAATGISKPRSARFKLYRSRRSTGSTCSIPIAITNVNGTTVTATTLADNIAGAGITVVSATYSGDNSQAGTFTSATGYTSEWLGYGTGVVFSTGNATTSVITSAASTNASTNTSVTSNDADFGTIGGGTANDASFLEVTFVPTSSRVTLQFTLGSEEYNEYVYANFNDAIGVWVNGTHISVTPTGEAVAIDTINQAATYNPGSMAIRATTPIRERCVRLGQCVAVCQQFDQRPTASLWTALPSR